MVLSPQEGRTNGENGGQQDKKKEFAYRMFQPFVLSKDLMALAKVAIQPRTIIIGLGVHN